MPGLIVLFVIVAIALVAGSWYFKKVRRDELQTFAAQHGLQFSADDPFDLPSYPFKLFSLGDGCGAENVMWGAVAGMKLRLFDYWYYTTSTDAQGHTSRSYNRFTCGLSPLGATCPQLVISRESILSRIASHVGFHDIEFESDDFNKEFRVTGPDRKFAYAIIDSRMMQWLLDTTGFEFEVNGPYILVISGKLRPAELPNVVAALRGFREHVPAVVASLYPVSEQEHA